MVRKSSKLISSARPLGPLRRFLWEQRGGVGNALPGSPPFTANSSENSALLDTQFAHNGCASLGFCSAMTSAWGHRGPHRFSPAPGGPPRAHRPRAGGDTDHCPAVGEGWDAGLPGCVGWCTEVGAHTWENRGTTQSSNSLRSIS